MSAGVLPQTQLGELTALSRLPSWYQAAGGEWRGWDEGLGDGERGREGEGGMGKGEKSGKLGE